MLLCHGRARPMQESSPRSWPRRLIRGTVWVVVALWWSWCGCALWFAPWPAALSIVAAVVLGGAVVIGWHSRWRLMNTVLAALALTVVWCATVRPQVDRGDWSPDQARLAEVRFDGDRVA